MNQEDVQVLKESKEHCSVEGLFAKVRVNGRKAKVTGAEGRSQGEEIRS